MSVCPEQTEADLAEFSLMPAVTAVGHNYAI